MNTRSESPAEARAYFKACVSGDFTEATRLYCRRVDKIGRDKHVIEIRCCGERMLHYNLGYSRCEVCGFELETPEVASAFGFAYWGALSVMDGVKI